MNRLSLGKGETKCLKTEMCSLHRSVRKQIFYLSFSVFNSSLNCLAPSLKRSIIQNSSCSCPEYDSKNEF